MLQKESIIKNFNIILSQFKIRATCTDYYQLNKNSFYEIKLHPATKIQNIEKYSSELSLSLRETGTPKVNVLLDKGVVRMEFINPISDPVEFYKYASNYTPPKEYVIPALLGKSSYGDPVCVDLMQNPHMLVAGCTGSGKSVALHNIIANALKFSNPMIHIMDPKIIEHSGYENFNKIKVASSYQHCLDMLKSLNQTMEDRFELMKYGYDENDIEPILLVIDEFADLSLQDNDKSFYNNLCRLAQKCRAARISIVLATQRPSSKLLDGNIKANFPARLSFKVAGPVDSKIIIDEKGAENLHGKGDAILKCYQYQNTRLQIAYTDAKQVVKHGYC